MMMMNLKIVFNNLKGMKTNTTYPLSNPFFGMNNDTSMRVPICVFSTHIHRYVHYPCLISFPCVCAARSMVRRGVVRRRKAQGAGPGRAAITQATCQHPVLITPTLCGVCGAVLKPGAGSLGRGGGNSDGLPDGATTVNVSGGYAITVSRDEAQRISNNMSTRLLTAHKLALVLDLDATLLHASVRRTEQVVDVLKYNEILRKGGDASKREVAARRESYVYAFKMGGVDHYVKFRPGLFKFLEQASKRFLLHIYTHGTREYAENIAKLIDPAKEYFQARILSRSDCPDGLRQKELSRMFPSGTAMVGVVDDRDDVWSDYLSNLYKIEPYAFWKVKPKEEVNNSSGESLAEKAPAEKGEAVLDGVAQAEHSIDAEDDRHLEHCLRVFERVHATFYRECGGGGGVRRSEWNEKIPKIVGQQKRATADPSSAEAASMPSLPRYLTAIRLSILKGTNIVFTSIIPSGLNVVKHRFARLVYLFGGTISKNVTPGVTHVVAGRPGTEKCVQGMQIGAHVVSKGWFVGSVSRWKRLNEREYYYPEMAKYGNINAPPGSASFSPGLKLNYDNPTKKKTKKTGGDLEVRDAPSKKRPADCTEEGSAEKRLKVEGDGGAETDGSDESSDDSSEDDIDVNEFL